MIYYGRYKLANGKWQQWAIFNSKKEALETLQFHAQGREIELLSETEYKNKKRRTKQMTTKKSQQKSKKSTLSGPKWGVIRFSDLIAFDNWTAEFHLKRKEKLERKRKKDKTINSNNQTQGE